MFPFTITSENDTAVVKNADGEIASIPELEALSISLKNLKKKLTNDWMASELYRINSSIKWVFPKNRTEGRASGPCVYFVKIAKFEGKIKIGMTHSLLTRTSALYNQHKSEVKILAFGKTLEYDKLEKLLHYRFREHRVGTSELFHDQEILSYIEGLKS